MIKRQLLGLSEHEQIPEHLIYGRWATPNSLTMIGLRRLENIEQLIKYVIENNIDGHLIETGVWRGGAVIYMKYLLNQYGSKKKLFVADSFNGLPIPDEKYPADNGDAHSQIAFLRVSKDEVMANFKKFGLLDKRVKFVHGWFKYTLPKLNERFCIMRLDGDMYESTINALESLYHKLSPGGFVIIDDYFLPNCKQAVVDFREKNGITGGMIVIDESSIYWQKT